MCFSATASFAVAATLLPVGGYTLARTRHRDRRWLLFASYPLAFGTQQLIEGFLWLGLEAGSPALTAIAGRGFLFFSHFWWPAFVPLSVWWLERGSPRRGLLMGLALIGALFGLSIFVPAAVQADWLRVEVIAGNIEYRTTLIYDGYVGRVPLRGFYAAVVVGALWLSRERWVRVFGGLIALSLIGTLMVYPHAFISVWCFFAAMLSLYVTVMIVAKTRAAPARPAT